MKKFLFVIFVAVIPGLLSALECEVCRKNIHGKYIKTANGAYCSQECYHSTFPKCEFCKKPCTKRNVQMMGKTFCSKSCMHKIFHCSLCLAGLDNVITLSNFFGDSAFFCQKCSRRPGCYYCAMPGDRPAGKDGRVICKKCRSTLVTSPKEVHSIFRQVRRDLAGMFKYDAKHKIELKIVSPDELNKQAGSIYMPENSKRMSLMRYSNKITEKRYSNGKVKRIVTDEKCQIFVLSNVPKDMLYDALAHELTHDYLRHNIGKVNDLALEEGFCELIASLYNQKRGKDYLNRQKEAQKDPVYGGGFRKMRAIYRKNRSFSETLKSVR